MKRFLGPITGSLIVAFVALWCVGAAKHLGPESPRLASALYGVGMATIKVLIPGFLILRFWGRKTPKAER